MLKNLRVLVVAAVGSLALATTLALAQKPDGAGLSELEQTQLELLHVRAAYAQLVAQYDGCKAEVGAVYNTLGQLRASAATTELTSQERKLKADIESAHAGYTFDPKSGVLTKKTDAK